MLGHASMAGMQGIGRLLLLFDWVYYEVLISNTTYKNRDKWAVVS